MINRILFYNSGGGFGDALQILPLINTLKIELKNTKFYYLSAHDNHFNSSLKNLNCHIDTLSLDISRPERARIPSTDFMIVAQRVALPVVMIGKLTSSSFSLIQLITSNPSLVTNGRTPVSDAFRAPNFADKRNPSIMIELIGLESLYRSGSKTGNMISPIAPH